MKTPMRWLQLVWLLILALFIAIVIFPVSSRLTRGGGLVLFAIVWFGAIALWWNLRSVRHSMAGLTLLVAGFLALPARSLPHVQTLRDDYLAGLRRYDGIRYYWGGENAVGIDCSGLTRRGLVDSLFLRGIRTADAGLVRQSLKLWWHDCTARALGNEHENQTVRVLDTPSVNQLDHTRILPGDLAITGNGVHILAYLGDQVWIEADPAMGRVIQVSAPAKDNIWFTGPATIVRWRILQP